MAEAQIVAQREDAARQREEVAGALADAKKRLAELDRREQQLQQVKLHTCRLIAHGVAAGPCQTVGSSAGAVNRVCWLEMCVELGESLLHASLASCLPHLAPQLHHSPRAPACLPRTPLPPCTPPSLQLSRQLDQRQAEVDAASHKLEALKAREVELQVRCWRAAGSLPALALSAFMASAHATGAFLCHPNSMPGAPPEPMHVTHDCLQSHLPPS